MSTRSGDEAGGMTDCRPALGASGNREGVFNARHRRRGDPQAGRRTPMPKRSVAHAAHLAVDAKDTSFDRPPESPGRELPAAWEDGKASARARNASKARAASTRRRRVDPTTCD